MDSKKRLEAEYLKLFYFEDKNLRWYQIISIRKYVVSIMSIDIMIRLVDYVLNIYGSGRLNNKEPIVCGNCFGEFIVSGRVCSCYDNINGFHNYIAIIPNGTLPNVEQVFKGLKAKVKAEKAKAKRRELEKFSEGIYSKDDISILFNLQDGLCYYCMKPIENSGKNKFAIDHIVPLSSEGTNWPENLALTCKSCNSQKSTTTEAKFLRIIRKEKPESWCEEHKSFIADIKRYKLRIFKRPNGR